MHTHIDEDSKRYVTSVVQIWVYLIVLPLVLIYLLTYLCTYLLTNLLTDLLTCLLIYFGIAKPNVNTRPLLLSYLFIVYLRIYCLVIRPFVHSFTCFI